MGTYLVIAGIIIAWVFAAALTILIAGRRAALRRAARDEHEDAAGRPG